MHLSRTIVKEINKNPIIKMMCEAYTAGVYSYINQLKDTKLPLEFKLLNYKPGHWTLLDIALLQMLGGHGIRYDDLEFTNVRKVFTKKDFEKLFPIYADSLRTVVPNTPENPYSKKSAVDLSIPANADSLYLTFKKTV